MLGSASVMACSGHKHTLGCSGTFTCGGGACVGGCGMIHVDCVGCCTVGN